MNNDTKDFINLIVNMSKEFDYHKGHITSEISVHKNDVELLKDTVRHTNLRYGRWIISECDTCVKQHGEGFYHASIEMNLYSTGKKGKWWIWISKKPRNS